MRKTAYILLFVWLAAFVAAGCRGKASSEEAAEVDTLPMLVMQIRKCSRLYTTEYRVHKIVTFDDVVRFRGKVFSKSYSMNLPLGDRKVAIPIDAKLKAYIDFSEFSEQNIERQGDRITIILPDPKVTMTSSKIDQKNVKEYVSLTRAHFSDAELASYQQQGRQAIIASIPELGMMETAQANAAKVLVPMLTEMGFKEENVTIAFRKHYGADDIMKLLKMED